VYEAGKEMRYKIAVANKKGVQPYGPFIPQPNVFLKGSETRQFLLTKLINAERAALHAPSFKEKMARTRSGHLKTIYNDLLLRVESIETAAAELAVATTSSKTKKNIISSVGGNVMRGASRVMGKKSDKEINKKDDKDKDKDKESPTPRANITPRKYQPPSADEKSDKYKRIFFRCESIPELSMTEFTIEPSSTVKSLIDFAARITEKPIEAVTLFKGSMQIKNFSDLFELHGGDVINITIQLPTLSSD
jgi:hypothetical protein